MGLPSDLSGWKTNGNCACRQRHRGHQIFLAPPNKPPKTTPCTVAGRCRIKDLPTPCNARGAFDTSGKTPAQCHHPANAISSHSGRRRSGARHRSGARSMLRLRRE
ncbi:hypothetical protein CDS [Bradyrhizobium sp.]|nr:hypothetical protein CDS [Bradyrhizobium sp.]